MRHEKLFGFSKRWQERMRIERIWGELTPSPLAGEVAQSAGGGTTEPSLFKREAIVPCRPLRPCGAPPPHPGSPRSLLRGVERGEG
jgi:hypothetical protein